MPFSQVAKQSLFDEAARAVLRQGKLCKQRHICVYDDGAGNHCALGHILKARGEPLKELRNVGVGSAIAALRHGEQFASSRVGRLLSALRKLGADCEQDLWFLQELQAAHDGADDIAGYVRAMQRLATSSGLSAAALAST
jgi:hypothetical protein